MRYVGDFDFEFNDEDCALTGLLYYFIADGQGYLGSLVEDDDGNLWMRSPYVCVGDLMQNTVSEIHPVDPIMLDPQDEDSLVAVSNSDSLRQRYAQSLLSSAYINNIPIMVNSLRH